MKKYRFGPLLCLLAVGCMLGFLCCWAGTPQQAHQPEPAETAEGETDQREEEAALAPLTVQTVTDRDGLRRFSFTLEGEQIRNLFAMTPHLFRISRAGAQRLSETTRLRDTASCVLNIYRAI